VDPALDGHVVQGGGDVQCEWDQLLHRQRPVPADQTPERRALEVLDQEMRVPPVKDRIEAAHENRVGEALERFRLLPQLA
jgi:hypothetical protein